MHKAEQESFAKDPFVGYELINRKIRVSNQKLISNNVVSSIALLKHRKGEHLEDKPYSQSGQ